MTPLVVGTTYDPATPYRGAKNLVRTLGNARLLTMRGDGHTAYSATQLAACISAAVEAYVNDVTLPAPGTQCRQAVGFPAPAAVQAFAAVPQVVEAASARGALLTDQTRTRRGASRRGGAALTSPRMRV